MDTPELLIERRKIFFFKKHYEYLVDNDLARLLDIVELQLRICSEHRRQFALEEAHANDHTLGVFHLLEMMLFDDDCKITQIDWKFVAMGRSSLDKHNAIVSCVSVRNSQQEQTRVHPQRGEQQ